MSTRCGAEFLFYVVGPSRRRRGHTQQQSLTPPQYPLPLTAHLHHTNARTSSPPPPPAESTTMTTLCSSQSPKPTNQNSSRTWGMLHSPAAAAAAGVGARRGWGSNSTRHDATRLDSTQSRRRRRRHRGYNLYPTIHLANTHTRNPPPPPPLPARPRLGSVQSVVPGK